MIRERRATAAPLACGLGDVKCGGGAGVVGVVRGAVGRGGVALVES